MKKLCTCPLTLLTYSVIDLCDSEAVRHRKSKQKEYEELSGDGNETPFVIPSCEFPACSLLVQYLTRYLQSLMRDEG